MFIAITILIIALSVAVYIRKKQYLNIVRKKSNALKNISDINRKYNFFTCDHFDEEHTYDNFDYYEIISCEDFLIYQLQFQQHQILREINKAKANKQKYDEYMSEVSRAATFGTFDIPKTYRRKKLAAIEKNLFRRQILKPVIEFKLIVTLHCAKMSGEIYAVKQGIFGAEKIKALIARINNKRGYFYNDRGVWDALCRVERGKVSNKMRFSVYERDGYRCKICGMSGAFCDLEIDHIKPISKGGKSTYDNLQTLCRRCNKMKGNDY